MESYKKKILIIDNEALIRDRLAEKLTILGYQVISTSNGREGLFVFNKEKFNLIILDVLLPKLDGYELCQKIRQQSQVPIVILTALKSISERVVGFRLGADDYITKPFSLNELEARIQNILRRSNIQPTKDNSKPYQKKFHIANLLVDIQKRQVFKKETLIRLTKIEFKLFEMLIENAGKELSRTIILANLWGYTTERYGDTRIVDVNISRLRGKIEDIPSKPTFILTVRGKGYMFQKD